MATKITDLPEISSHSSDDVFIIYDSVQERTATIKANKYSTLDISDLESTSGSFNLVVDPDYTGSVETGSDIRPYKTIQSAISNASDGDSILIKGSNLGTSQITLPSDKSLHFYGQEDTLVGYTTYDPNNGSTFYVDALDNTKSYSFNNLNIKNSGAYGVHTKNTLNVVLRDCVLTNNGWSGTSLNTILPSGTSGLLGYDSSAADLQAFYASSAASDGGAARIENSTFVEMIGNEATKNLRGLRIQDCGVGGAGVVTRNRSSQNIEAGIYLAAGSTHYGCQNIIVANNSSSYNANNGYLCIGGLNNKFSHNDANGNWNAAWCVWGSGNATWRSGGVFDNNRSTYNGIGNVGDAKASIQINDAYNLLGTTISINPAARFIAEILDTQVHYTGLGSNVSKVGIYLSPTLSALADNDKNIINIDDVGFIGQDYAIDFSDVDLTNLRVALGDNSYHSIGQKAINPPLAGSYHELPFSNHSMKFPAVDFNVTNTGNVEVREGVGGTLINPYSVNELQALAHKTEIKVVLKGTDKIQFVVPVSGATINGVAVNSVQSLAVTQLNDLFTNTVGFTSGGGNPVTNFALTNNNLTLTLQDGTSFTVDVTTLGVDENKFVTSGALNGSNLELTMNDSSIITIDASNMINGSSLPSRAEDWYIAYGNNSGDVVTYPSVVSAIKDKQPFYNGDFLEKGEEYIWTHEVGGEYVLGVYSGSEATNDEVDIFLNNKWSTNFKFGTTVKETSVGVDVASRYASGYTISNNTALSLRYGNDNYLYLFDISDPEPVLIGKSNTALVGNTQTIFFGGDNQPNAKFPVMIKRKDTWTIVADFDNSEGGEWSDGIEQQTIVKSNLEIEPNYKLVWQLPAAGNNRSFGIGYTGAATGESNPINFLTGRFRWDVQEIIGNATGWTLNTSNSLYDNTSFGQPYWNLTDGNSVTVSLRYNNNNVLELWDEDRGEVIMTWDSTLNGTPISLYYGATSYSSTSTLLPNVSVQQIGQGPQPTTNFAPDISDQTIDITKNQAFNVPITLDSGSDIVTQYGELDAPSWAVLNQSTGYFYGTAPSTTGTHVIACKAGNPLGGIVNFNVTLNVVEPVYTNTKSLQFQDGVSSYLGGNASLVTALERSSNGSGASDAWTIAFWFKGSASNTGQTLFYFGAQDTTNNGHIEIKQTNNNGLKRLRIRYGSNVNHLQLTTPNSSIDPTKWQHVVVAYNGGTTGVASGSITSYYSRFKIYIDGVLQSTNNTHNNNGYNGSIVGQNYRFGRFASGNYPKDILLNQLAIWNSDQSSNISGLYNNGNTQDISLLVAGSGNMNTNYLPPDHYYEIETSVSSIQDLEGNAHFIGYNFLSSDLVNSAP